MKLETITIKSGSPSPVRESRPVEKKEPEKKAVQAEQTALPAQKVGKAKTSEEAQKVAQKLQHMVDEANIRFVVKDPTGTGSDNVVIEVRDENNKVIARIPEDVINNIHSEVVQTGKQDMPKGLLLNQFVK